MPQGSFVDDSYADPEVNGKVIFDTVKCSWVTGACGSASGPELAEYEGTYNLYVSACGISSATGYSLTY